MSFVSFVCYIILKIKTLFCKISPERYRKSHLRGTLDFKIFRGSMPPDPPRMAHAFGVRPPPKTMTLATPLYNHVTNGMIDSLLMLYA